MNRWAATILAGIKWSSTSTIMGTLTQVVLMALLARQASAEDLGKLALSFVFVRLISPLVDGGFSNAWIQSTTAKPGIFRGLSALQWIIGTSLFVLTWIISEWCVRTQSLDGDIIQMIQVLSFSFLLGPLGLMHLGQLRKAMQFSVIGKVQFTAFLSEGILGVFMLYTGWGIWSIILAYLIRQAVLSIGYYLYNRPFVKKTESSRTLPREEVRFGLYEMAGQWVNQWSTQVDKILVSLLLGHSALGWYSLAWDLVILPLSKLNGIISTTSYPIFAKLDDRFEERRWLYNHVHRLLWTCSLPILFILCFFTRDMIHLIYGPGWEVVTQIIPILCGAVLFKIWAYSGQTLLLSMGFSREVFYWNIGWTLSLVLVFYGMLSTWPSVYSAAWAQVITAVFVSWVWHVIIYKKSHLSFFSLVPMMFQTIKAFLPTIVLIPVAVWLPSPWGLFIFTGIVAINFSYIVPLLFDKTNTPNQVK